MLIKALCDYCDILLEENKVPEMKYSYVNASYKVLIDSNGNLKDILKYQKEVEEEKVKKKSKKEEKKYEPIQAVFPRRKEKTSTESEIIEHRGKYLFGISYEKKSKQLKIEKNKGGKQLFEFCKEVNLEFIDGINSDVAKAYENFLKNWNPENESNNNNLLNLKEDLNDCYFVIALYGDEDKLLNEDDGVKEKWESDFKNYIGKGNKDGICSITGKREKIARTHMKIKGVKGGNPSGCTLVCVKVESGESYGKEQGFVSPISDECNEKYTKALNYLLSNEKHKVIIDNINIVFWSESKNKECDDFLSFLINNDLKEEDLDNKMKKIFDYLKEGKAPDIKNEFENLETKFYIVGFVPNNSRISIRFMYENNFGNLIENVVKYERDVMLKESERLIGLYQIKEELVSPKSKDKKIKPSLMTDIFKAIIWGGKFPNDLLVTLVKRIKVDKIVDSKKSYCVRIGLLKAYINRAEGRDYIKMALDKNNENVAYLCGRLFAVIERTQIVSINGEKLNKTIKDKYLSLACSTPVRIFPELLKLSEYYSRKIDNEGSVIYLSNIKGEIMEKLECEFPSMLDLNEQGKFLIGYYQQRQEFFKKKEENENE